MGNVYATNQPDYGQSNEVVYPSISFGIDPDPLPIAQNVTLVDINSTNQPP